MEMNESLRQLYQRLTEAPGAPGFESQVRAVMKEELVKYSDCLVEDGLGSLFGLKRGQQPGPRIMVAGHMDEVGFMVTQITEEGFIRFQPLGGWWSQVLLAQRVQIITENGPLDGVIGSVPPHLLEDADRKKPMEIKKMFIDVGADNKEEAYQMGIRPGQPIVPVCPFTPLGNGKKIMAKAWDNRYGCGLAIHLLKEVRDETLPNHLYSGATVQEEVGLRGAQTAVYRIDPDIAFVLDAGPAGDTPGAQNGIGRLGQGVLLRIYDRTMITHPLLRDFILDTAESENIPYQFFVSQGGTDAGRIHISRKGVPSAVIGICARYIHSHASIAHTDDIMAASQLLVALVKQLDLNTVNLIKRGR
jgi:putative aminopeptidase FrvX